MRIVVITNSTAVLIVIFVFTFTIFTIVVIVDAVVISFPAVVFSRRFLRAHPDLVRVSTLLVNLATQEFVEVRKLFSLLS